MRADHASRGSASVWRMPHRIKLLDSTSTELVDETVHALSVARHSSEQGRIANIR